MSLTLTLVQSPAGVRAPAESKAFDQRGGTIGRSAQNDWHLPDPSNRVSREHCRIIWDGARYYLEDVSANGVFLNGAPAPVGRGNRVPLGHGDRLAIGDYEATASLAEAPAATAPAVFGPPNDDPFAVGDARPGAQAPFGQGAQAPFGQGAQAPFGQGMPAPFERDADAPFGPGVGVRSTTAFDHGGGPAGRGKAAAPLIPIDDDIFGGGDASSGFDAPRSEPLPWEPDPVEAPPSAADHSPSPQDYFRPPGVVGPAPGGSAIPDDWDAEPAPPPPAGSPPKPARAATAPPPAPDFPPPPAVAPRPPAPSPDDSGDRALRAFLDGAGMPDLMIRPDQVDAVMRLAGATYREMTTALREIMEARAALKREFRVEPTLIHAARNNPLKFAPTVEAALATMLSNDQRGYQPAPEAVREAAGDIKSHELATFAAVQEVMAELLQRLAPAAVEQTAAKGDGLGSLVGGGRRARAWEEYQRAYAAAKEHFDDRFAEVFRRKYAEAFRQMR